MTSVRILTRISKFFDFVLRLIKYTISVTTKKKEKKKKVRDTNKQKFLLLTYKVTFLPKPLIEKKIKSRWGCISNRNFELQSREKEQVQLRKYHECKPSRRSLDFVFSSETQKNHNYLFMICYEVRLSVFFYDKGFFFY